MPATMTADVVIVGAGPAGLTAAAELGPGLDVVVLERESEAGGIPRHSDHLGYGVRDLKRFLSGPEYARRLCRRATDAGAVIHTEAMVTGWAGERALDVTSPHGRYRIYAGAIILATGARERPRPARLIPGDRPSGVYTTGQLQNLVHLKHRDVGRRAVVVGAELVSYSAVLTLEHAGCHTTLMTTTHPSPESYAAFNLAARSPLLGLDIATRTRVSRIIGRHALEAVEVEDVESGSRRLVECDTLVLTGDWIPDHELARAANLDMDPKTLGPLTDTALRTSRPGVFAIGNLLHPVDTADIAALDGRHVAHAVRAHLRRDQTPDGGVRLRVESPLRWVTPGIIRPGDAAPARGRLLLWSDELVRIPNVTVHQDGRLIARKVLPWPASPGRVFRVPSSLLDRTNPRGGSVTISITERLQ